MLKITLRFLVVVLIAVALGLLVYHLNQPAGTVSFGSGINDFRNLSRDIGNEHGFREGSFNLARGLFGVTGNLLLVAMVTVIVVSMQKMFAHKAEPAKAF